MQSEQYSGEHYVKLEVNRHLKYVYQAQDEMDDFQAACFQTLHTPNNVIEKKTSAPARDTDVDTGSLFPTK